MTHTVNIHEAKTQLSRLLEAAGRGEDVIFARNGQPVARLVPYAAARRRPGGGARPWPADGRLLRRVAG